MPTRTRHSLKPVSQFATDMAAHAQFDFANNQSLYSIKDPECKSKSRQVCFAITSHTPVSLYSLSLTLILSQVGRVVLMLKFNTLPILRRRYNRHVSVRVSDSIVG